MSGCPLFLGVHFTAVDLKIGFEILRWIPIFTGKFVFWWGEFLYIQEND
jgi:hypothetical protein